MIYGDESLSAMKLLVALIFIFSAYFTLFNIYTL